MTSLFDIAGKTAVVTGGAKGIGAMISRSLVGAGACFALFGTGTSAAIRYSAAVRAGCLD